MGDALKLVVSRDGEAIRITVPMAEGGRALITLSLADARGTGLALLEMAQRAYPEQRPSFDEPAISLPNPPVEIRSHHRDQVLIAVASAQLGPLVLEFDQGTTRELRDALTLAIGAAAASP
jgi:hypothetical protein